LTGYGSQQKLSKSCWPYFLYQSRSEYRRAWETAGKSGKQIERCVIPSFRIAQNMGFQGDFRQCAFAADWRFLSGAVEPPIERGIDL